jgi:hypothetical protein
MAVWAHVANCLRCGSPIYSVGQGEGDDPPKTRYSCHCWDEKPVPNNKGWVTNVTEKVTDKGEKNE